MIDAKYEKIVLRLNSPHPPEVSELISKLLDIEIRIGSQNARQKNETWEQ